MGGIKTRSKRRTPAATLTAPAANPPHTTPMTTGTTRTSAVVAMLRWLRRGTIATVRTAMLARAAAVPIMLRITVSPPPRPAVREPRPTRRPAARPARRPARAPATPPGILPSQDRRPARWDGLDAHG